MRVKFSQLPATVLYGGRDTPPPSPTRIDSYCLLSCVYDNRHAGGNLHEKAIVSFLFLHLFKLFTVSSGQLLIIRTSRWHVWEMLNEFFFLF